MTKHKRQGGTIRTKDGRSHSIVSDDNDRMLIRDLETGDLAWVGDSDVERVTSAATMTKWETSDTWQVHHDMHLHGDDSFPTTDGDRLVISDRVRSAGPDLILGDGIGVIDSFESVDGSIHVGLRPAGLPHSWTWVPLVQLSKVKE